jgi:hypothetical protein
LPRTAFTLRYEAQAPTLLKAVIPEEERVRNLITTTPRRMN